LDRPTVLLVDDTPQILEYCTRVLARHYEVIGTASNGIVALEICAAINPDVIVLDISMPGLNGIEVARRLRSSGCRAAIVFLSSEELIPEAMEAGGSAFVEKSLMSSDLLVAIREALAGRRFISTFPTDESD